MGPALGQRAALWGWRGPASLVSLLESLGMESQAPAGTHLCHPHAVPSLHRGDAISYARIHQQQKQMDEEKLTGTLEGQAL